MKHSMGSWNALLAALSIIVSTVTAQSYSTCNPLTSGSCPADPALGKSVKIDFTSGASDSFTPQGNPVYGSNGAALTVSAPGDAPQLTSKWYIMFGHVDYVIKAAPGAGIVSSAVLQSDDLDEIDWEWLGGDDNQVQSNYFGKGLTLNYNRGAYHSAPGNHDGFSTYSIDWTADQITWSINGQTVRTLSSSTASQYPYPQTPMMVKVGAWCGGCSGNAEGTIQWAGATESIAPGSTMYVKSIAVTDYSTGSQYKYTGTTGTWQSIEAVGGKVNSNGSPGSANAAAAAAAPSSESTSSNGGPMPFDGTHSDKQSTSEQPNAGGWTPTTSATGGSQTATTYPGLPSGWSVTSSGKVIPPSAAPVTSPASLPSSSPEGSPHGSPNGQSEEVVTEFDGKGFPLVLSVPADSPAVAKHYDEQGFLITTGLIKRALPTPISAPEEPAAAEQPNRPQKALRMYRRSLGNSTSDTSPGSSSAILSMATGTAVGTGDMTSGTSTPAPTFYQSSSNGASLAGVTVLTWSALAAGLVYAALLA